MFVSFFLSWPCTNWTNFNVGSSRAAKTNGNITAERVLLVLEMKDGSKEHTLVSREQALDAAEAANLDLVQGKLQVGRRHALLVSLPFFPTQPDV